MAKITRNDIHIIARFSNWKAKLIENSLHENEIFLSASNRENYLKIFLISVGVLFAVTGIGTFFAYNWNDLPRVAKLAISQGLLIGAISSIFLAKDLTQLVKDIIITGSAILVGVVLYVYGEVYQVLSNELIFFSLWTALITIWLVVTEFEALWIVYLTLLTFVVITFGGIYPELLSEEGTANILFVIYCATIIGVQALADRNFIKEPAKWFKVTLSLAAIVLISVMIIIGIVDDFPKEMALHVVLGTLFFIGGVWYALEMKQIFNLVLIPAAVIIIIASFLGKFIGYDNEILFFLILGVFVTTTFSLLIKYIIKLKGEGYE